MNTTRVVNRNRELYDVYIGRPSKWGNPFIPIDKSPESRLVAIKQYEEWILEQPELLASLHELNGKTLGCYCRPIEGFKGRVLCHGQILVALVDGIKPEEVT